MRHSWYKKSLVFGTIVIFVGTSIISATSLNLNNREINKVSRQLFNDPFFHFEFINKIIIDMNIGQSVQQTADNGYIVTGFKGEIDTNDPYSSSNVKSILMKYDVNGNKEWSKIFELIGGNIGYSVQQKEDDGYIIGGSIVSSDNTFAMLLKTDDQGNKEWMKTYEGLENSQGTMVHITNDNGYILTGSSSSLGDINISHIFLVKTDENGNEEWNETYTFLNSSIGNSVQQTDDQGFIICGHMISSNEQNSSVILVKTDVSGDREWIRTFKFMDINRGYSVQQTDDLGYIISGYMILSEDFKTNALLLKTDENGYEEWHQSFNDMYGFYTQQTEDEGYIICGTTASKKIPSAFLLKTDENGNEEWNKTYTGFGVAQGIMVQQTNDNGFILTGTTFKSLYFTQTYVLLIKTDEVGNLEWSTNFNRKSFNKDLINSLVINILERFLALRIIGL
jgi:hypothetical protein